MKGNMLKPSQKKRSLEAWESFGKRSEAGRAKRKAMFEAQQETRNARIALPWREKTNSKSARATKS